MKKQNSQPNHALQKKSPLKSPTEVKSSLEDFFVTHSSLNEQPHKTSSDPYPLTDEEKLIPLHTIYIHPIALEKMFLMANTIYSVFREPFEIYALCLGKDRYIYDLLIPEQFVSYASVHIDPVFLTNLRPQLAEQPYDVLGWTHSHANFDVFFSGTDQQNQLTVLHDTSNYTTLDSHRVKFSYGMTVNNQHQTYGVVTTQYPSGEIVHLRAQIQIVEDTAPHTTPDIIKKELAVIIKKKVFRFPINPKFPKENKDSEITDLTSSSSSNLSE